MKSPQFTPGPWRTNTSIHPDDQVFSQTDEIIADCKWTNHIPKTREANARLIAEAPDLLAQLIDARDLLYVIAHQGNDSVLMTHIGQYDDAIKRATGQ